MPDDLVCNACERARGFERDCCTVRPVFCDFCFEEHRAHIHGATSPEERSDRFARLVTRADAIDELEDAERAELEELFGGIVWNHATRRWYVDGEPVHAGTTLEVRGFDRANEDNPTPKWFSVRVESENLGRTLVAYIDHHGLAFRLRLASMKDDRQNVLHPLRWPR